MFVNFSNHPSNMWSEKQKKETIAEFGGIIDVAFPQVSPECSTEDVLLLAGEYADRICAMNPEAVMCQGEFGLTYAVVQGLKKKGIKVVNACSERRVIETVNELGEYVKTATFQFVKYREY